MQSATRTSFLVFIAILLVALVTLLAIIAVRGIHIHHTGYVSLGPMEEALALRMDAPVQLVMPEAVRMVTTGPDGGDVPLGLDLISCADCEGTMVPVRWNVWTGEIDWVCPSCGRLNVVPQEAP